MKKFNLKSADEKYVQMGADGKPFISNRHNYKQSTGLWFSSADQANKFRTNVGLSENFVANESSPKGNPRMKYHTNKKGTYQTIA